MCTGIFAGPVTFRDRLGYAISYITLALLPWRPLYEYIVINWSDNNFITCQEYKYYELNNCKYHVDKVLTHTVFYQVCI